jgi:hypothetical protein
MTAEWQNTAATHILTPGKDGIENGRWNVLEVEIKLHSLRDAALLEPFREIPTDKTDLITIGHPKDKEKQMRCLLGSGPSDVYIMDDPSIPEYYSLKVKSEAQTSSNGILTRHEIIVPLNVDSLMDLLHLGYPTAQKLSDRIYTDRGSFKIEGGLEVTPPFFRRRVMRHVRCIDTGAKFTVIADRCIALARGLPDLHQLEIELDEYKVPIMLTEISPETIVNDYLRVQERILREFQAVGITLVPDTRTKFSWIRQLCQTSSV